MAKDPAICEHKDVLFNVMSTKVVLVSCLCGIQAQVRPDENGIFTLEHVKRALIYAYKTGDSLREKAISDIAQMSQDLGMYDL